MGVPQNTPGCRRGRGVLGWALRLCWSAGSHICSVFSYNDKEWAFDLD